MADSRMFHRSVVESDPFLDMPTSAQALYFHLGMYADDDGFVSNPRQIVRLLCASAEDLRMLVDKLFLLEFENGVIVVRHWRVSNSLKNDRIKPVLYPELAERIYITPGREYTLEPTEGADTLLEHRRKEINAKKAKDAERRSKKESGMESTWNPSGY